MRLPNAEEQGLKSIALTIKKILEEISSIKPQLHGHPSGGASSIGFRDEGVDQGASAVLDVTGAGASVSVAGGVATLNVPGAGVPGAHADTHENGGLDEIDVTGLSGLLADPQTPLAHTHDDRYYTEGELNTSGAGGQVHWDNVTDKAATYAPSAHATSHQSGEADEINVGGLNGLLADPQTPAAHTHVEADITDLDHTDTAAIHDNVAGEIHAITEKVTPADNDELVIEDSADSFNKKRVKISNLPSGTGSGHTHVYNEDHSADCDDVETVFYADDPFVAGTLAVFLNGLRQTKDVDYSETWASTGAEFVVAPHTGDELIFDYIQDAAPMAISGPYTESGLDEVVITETHDHSTESDGNLSPADLTTRYTAGGLQALAITDHSKMTTPSGTAEISLNGEEVTLASGHLCGIGITKVVSPTTTVQIAINSILADGGFVQLNHPKWSTGYSLAELQTLTGYHAIEVFNMVCQHLSFTGWDVGDWDSLLTATRRNIWGIASDDYHTKTSDTATNVGRLIVFAKDRTAAEVLAALKRGDFCSSISNGGVLPDLPVVTVNDLYIHAPGALRIKFFGDNAALLQETAGHEATYVFDGTETYVRAEAIGQYDEPFDAALDANIWTNSGGTWTVSGGILSQSSTSATNYYCNRHLKGDIVGSVKIRAAAALAKHGLMVHWDGSSNYNVVRLNDGAIEIINQSGTILATTAFATVGNVWYNLKFDYVYATGVWRAKAWADGGSEPDWMLTYNGTASKYGLIGLRDNGQAGEYDDFHFEGFRTLYQPIPVGDWS